jgi:uncharacterized membrane protein YbhN (UPF0104 family)
MLSTTLRLPGSGLRRLIGEIAPGLQRPTRRRVWIVRVLALLGAGALAFLVKTRGREFVHVMDSALHIRWQVVAVAVALEASSVVSYVALLHRVVAQANTRLRVKDSYDMTLAGAAATRLVPTAGLGGAAVTVWALRARGVRAREITGRLLAFLVLLYSVYMVALLAAGVAVAFGWVPVPHGWTLGILGAAIALAFGALILVLFAAPTLVAPALERVGQDPGRLPSLLRSAVAQLPAFRDSLRRVGRELQRPRPALLGAVGYWAFDIGVLITMLHAFGVRLPLIAVVLAYFLGTMFNIVPLPGSLSTGLGGALIALGSPTGPAIAAVLAYRALAVWLPALPGLVSLASLRASVTNWRVEPALPTVTPRMLV